MCEVPGSRFSLLAKSTDKRYRSSEYAYRHFCSKCGCFIFGFVPETEIYYVSAAIIEDFNGNEPKKEIFIDTRKPWVRLCENSIKMESFKFEKWFVYCIYINQIQRNTDSELTT